MAVGLRRSGVGPDAAAWAPTPGRRASAAGRSWQAGRMPEMPASAKKALTSSPYQLFTRRVIVPWALQGERPSGEGLEIGAGSGSMTAQLLAAFPGLRMVATDYDIDMVQVARKTVAPFGDRATVEQADAGALPFEADRFDFVLSAAMLHHVGDWEKALAEILRVLRPGGRLIGYDLLDNVAMRLMHTGHEARLLRRGQLEAELHQLGFASVAARPGVGGLVVRFTATKAG